MRRLKHPEEHSLSRYNPDMPESLRAHLNEGWSPPLWARRNNLSIDVFDDICQLVPEMNEIRREYRTKRAGRNRFPR